VAGTPDFGDLHLVNDVSSADWIVAGVRNFEYDVGSLVPLGFDAYARVFHPAGLSDGADSIEVSWAAVAAANGRVAHAAMEWVAITGDWRFMTAGGQAGVWNVPPRMGSLPARQAVIVAEVLGRFTAMPSQCWFAIWDGYGDIRMRAAPKVAMPQRPMSLFAGPLSGVTFSFERPPSDQRAHLWWPEDRRWCVATDVDLMTTYVGGSADCITALLSDPRLESLPVSVDQSVTWRADTINPTPQPPPAVVTTPRRLP
jgi:hypothetical protein